MTHDELIKRAAERFLCWKLPVPFSPDNGISFTPPTNPDWWPVGTNLLDADQAKAMFEHCLAPQAAPAEPPDAGPVAWIADEELKRLKENGRTWVITDLWAVQQDYDFVGKTFTQIPLYLHPAPSDAQALRKALELSVQAMRAPFDGWKGELERKALDAARAALGSGK